MRNMEERIFEIHKRSRARIHRRRRLLTGIFVPLAAVCVYGVLLIPQGTTYPKDTTVPTGTTVEQYSGSVTVISGNLSVSYSNRDILESFQDLVSSLTPVEITPMDTVQKYTNHITVQTTGFTTNYKIILENEEGTAHYTLLDKILSNQDTDELFTLTDTQRADLLKLLRLN